MSWAASSWRIGEAWLKMPKVMAIVEWPSRS